MYRLAAYWIDFVIVAFVLVGLQLLTNVLTGGFPFRVFTKGYEIELWVLLTMSLPVWLYFILCEYRTQKTMGKKLFKIAVFHGEETKIRLSQAVIRTFIKLLPWELTHLIILVPEPWWGVEQPKNLHLIFVPNAMLIVYVVVLAANKGRKGIHDFMAKTEVRAT